MRYGYFDDAAREYVIDRMDVPVSMTNYLGTQRMGTVISHNAGGYSWLDSPQHHRITRFRPNLLDEVSCILAIAGYSCLVIQFIISG